MRDVLEVYSYTRIQRNQVRLLVIKAGKYADDIHTSLLVVSDQELGSESYPYCALSYHRGEGDVNNTVYIQEDAPSRSLRLLDDAVDVKQSKIFMVGLNLHEALRHLREEEFNISIWVDALCINQFDEEEKNAQVNKMAFIYQQAYNVNVWLGTDSIDNPVSDVAMSFIYKVINPGLYEDLLVNDKYIKSWASLFEILRWSCFSHRWIIQELALAQNATVHCGTQVCTWSDFETVIAIFCRHFSILKPKLISYFEETLPPSCNDESVFEIEQLGAKLLVETTANLFRPKKNGSRESTKGLETLVCSLSAFDTFDPRDTINALRNISKELNRPESRAAQDVPAPDYGKDLFEVYRDFVKWVVQTSESLDIICRFWARKERKKITPTTPQLVELPSWIQFFEDSAWGKGEDRFNGSKAGDSFVGLPDDHNYCASGQGYTYNRPIVLFPESPSHLEPAALGATPRLTPPVVHDTSVLIRGVTIGTVSYRTDPFSDGIITKDCLEKLGWSFGGEANEIAEVPDQLWQTLVADRGPQGTRTLPWYKVACQNALCFLSTNGHINIDRILQREDLGGEQSIVKAYFERVQAVTWNRSFIESNSSKGKDRVVGFAPPKTENGDVIAILYGCSVPVILRPTFPATGVYNYIFVGEAYIHGKMYGEVFDKEHTGQDFNLV